MSALLLQGVRCVPVLGPGYAQVRGAKRWLRPYLMMLEKKKRLEKPPEPVPRYQQPHFDFHAEILAFSKRLNESFSTELLKTAFVNHSYVVKEESERRELGVDKDLASLNLKDNRELSQQGLDFTASYLTSTIQQGFPNLPADGAKAYVDYLSSQPVLCHVAKNLGMDDLTLTAECPLSPKTLETTFFGVIGALLESSGADRTSKFLQDFLIPELIGKDLFDVWSVRDPMSLLVAQLAQRNVAAPEPRLTRQSGASTVLPVYFVGLYCDKQLIAEGAGETVIAAEEEAARVALRKMFGLTENRRPWDYPPNRQGTGDSAVLQSAC